MYLQAQVQLFPGLVCRQYGVPRCFAQGQTSSIAKRQTPRARLFRLPRDEQGMAYLKRLDRQGAA
jgi:hypothetical protein